MKKYKTRETCKHKILEYGFKIVISVSMFTSMLEISNCKLYAKTISGTRVGVIKQDIDGKEQVIGCSDLDCITHNRKKYGENGCVSGSDLFNIQIPIQNKKNKIKFKSLYDCKFKSMQGGCIKGNNLYIAFSDKGKIKGKDLTAIVVIDLDENKVKKVKLIKGVIEKNINCLGHTNDLTFQGDLLHAAWYQTKAKGKKYSDKVGYIKEDFIRNGKSVDVGKGKEKSKIAAFGIAGLKDKLALGIRYEGKSFKRYIGLYRFEQEDSKKGKYIKEKELFTLSSNKKFAAPQCMEYYKKNFYIIRFNKKGGNINNNCLEIYNYKGKRKKIYIVRDPKVKVKTMDSEDIKKNKNITKDMKKKKWEIESISHYKKNTFYFTQLKPSTHGSPKQAYLYKIKLKK